MSNNYMIRMAFSHFVSVQFGCSIGVYLVQLSELEIILDEVG